MTQTQTQQLNPQIFTIYSDEIKERLDPYFYLKVSSKIYKFPLIKLGNICQTDWGNTNLTKRIYQEKGFPVFSAKGQDGYADFYENNFDAIVLSAIGARCGKCFLARGKWTAIKNTIIIRLIDEYKADIQYLHYILDDEDLWEKSGGAQPFITLRSAKNLQIPLPPLPTQTQIVSIMQKAHQEKKQKEAEAKKLFESIDDYVLSELRIKIPKIKREMVFEIWSDNVENNRIDAQYWQPFLEKIKLAINKGKYKTEKLKNFISKIHYGASTSNAYTENGIPFLRILNLKPNYFDLSEFVYLPENFRKELGNAFVKAGDLLISRSGTVGIVSVVPKKADGFAFGSFMIKFCLNDEINKDFVSIWLNNKLNKLLTEREKIGAIQGNITISTIKNFDIPFPPLPVQKMIADKVKFCSEQAQKLKAEADNNLQKAKEKIEKIILE